MKGLGHIALLGLGLLVFGLLQVDGASAQDSGLKSLRGDVPVEETNPPGVTKKQNVHAGSFARAYRQQPPLIPHRIEKYQINLKVNQCMLCHDWPNNVAEGAPKISETHYVDRNGVALDYVARTRWFCTQCHVPQANARALVGNSFKPATEVE